MTGLSLPKDRLEKLFEVKIEEWKSEVSEVRDFLKPYKGRLPAEIREQSEKLERQVRGA
jgi:GTP-dependent phosphoenolpyruvate carboxykinase